ncbi:MAG: hypothetical protein ACTSW2_02955 [Alphaproteobacteria bacterium]
MRSFIVGSVAVVVIAIAAAVIMNTMSMTTAQTYTSSSVRQ